MDNFLVRKKLLYFLLVVIFLVFTVELIKKTLFAHLYYESLSQANKTKETYIQAPRGIFYDRDNTALTKNIMDKEGNVIRKYVFGPATAHVLGYLSLPDTINLKDYSCGEPPLHSQMVGKTGLERYFECSLRGAPGKILHEVDARGRIVHELAHNNPAQGKNIQLTISSKLQEAAHRAFDGQKGAAVATNPQTGEVLLFYSSPSFDPYALMSSESNEYEKLITDERQPLFNRLVLGLYPPGSVIKPLVALAGLEESVITPKTEYEDTGILTLGGVEFGNWYYLQYGKKEGMVDVVKAIARSNDIFFYKVGIALGIDHLNSWFARFNIDGKGLLPYFNQQKSTIPNNKWKQQVVGDKWYLGDTVNLSIGQGYLLVNPAQLHQAVSIVAGDGSLCSFFFEKGVESLCKSTGIAQDSIEVVKQGMIAACSTGGTGWPFFDFTIDTKPMPVACKTGTAESQQQDSAPHAWFTVFAPIDNPQIALTVLVENGGEGSYVAAPIAKEILTAFFK